MTSDKFRHASAQTCSGSAQLAALPRVMAPLAQHPHLLTAAREQKRVSDRAVSAHSPRLAGTTSCRSPLGGAPHARSISSEGQIWPSMAAHSPKHHTTVLAALVARR